MAYIRKSVRERQSNRERQNEINRQQQARASSKLQKLQKYKYVVYDRGEGAGSQAIVFSTNEVHYDMANQFCGGKKNVTSAGFCHMIADEVYCYGESTSIGVKSQPDEDKVLVKIFWEAQA